ncbi:enoyl-CoA hydratase-related protein [Streptomyces sp. NPDC005820]|uniref:enoyl-CoA hydratase-related protein n=1 Tax=Streptomyces sp. NPDC005820 TaxID=3157069 RepID=UPI0033D79439
MKTQLADGVLTVAIDRPERMNALTAEVMEQLADAIGDAATDDRVTVVVLAGDERAFCTGADLQTADVLGEDAAVAGATIDSANRLVAAIVQSPKPVVTLARGAVAGVGVPIALAADLVLCEEKTYFMLSFTKVGLMPDGGASAVVAASVGRARALRMALLAERLTAADALAAGLVTHVAPEGAFAAMAAQVLATLTSGPRVAFRRTKEAINRATLGGLEDAFHRERAGQIGLLAAHDFAEGSAAFREKRTPAFTDR